jgi:hypothetical protein
MSYYWNDGISLHRHLALDIEPGGMTVRINIESVFEQFDRQLSAALAKAALQTIPGMTTKAALRLYDVFRRNAITNLSPWEHMPSTALAGDTVTGATKAGDDGISLPPESKPKK